MNQIKDKINKKINIKVEEEQETVNLPPKSMKLSKKSYFRQ